MTHADPTHAILAAAGVAARELRAIGAAPLRPPPDLPGGFGLYGPTGSGKTWAMAQAAARYAQRRLADAWRWVDGEGHRHDPDFMLWLNWPQEANEIRRAPLAAAPRVAAAKRAGALFLDDIGAETAKTDADFALGILREIIDARYRGEKPTWWTSNLAPEGILAAYGGRIASRLFDAWPDHAWLGLDLRLAQAPMIQQAISLVPGGRA